MKNKIILFFAVVGMLTTLMIQDAIAAGQKEVMIGVSEVYVPETQSANSDAYVVVTGLFQNGCYHWSRAEVKHLNDFDHEVQSFALVDAGPCTMALVPFNREVRLGFLSPGTHRVRFTNGADDTFLEKRVLIR